jgi:peroxiredoxin
MRISPGQPAPDFTATALDGSEVVLSRLRGAPVWLAFFRWAACPFCNYRIHELLAQWGRRFSQYRFTMLGVFQSPAERCQTVIGGKQLPFITIPDPGMGLYSLYHVETGLKGMLSPDVPRTMMAARAAGIPLVIPIEGPLTRIPADFLIDGEGVVRAAFYGRNITEHIQFDQMERALETHAVRAAARTQGR